MEEIPVEQALRAADPLCLACSALYTELRLLLEESVVVYARTAFLNQSISAELDAIDALVDSVKKYLHARALECTASIKSLQTSQSELHALLAELKQVKLDERLVFIEQTPSLAAYVHSESIDAIDARIGTLLLELGAKKSEFAKSSVDLDTRLTNVYKLRPVFSTGIAKETPRRLAKLRQKAGTAATDATNVLLALTNQFDAVNDETDETDETKPGTQLETLRKAHDELKLRNRESQRVQRSLALTFTEFSAYGAKIAGFVPSIETTLSEIEVSNESSRELFSVYESVLTETQSLTQYYRMFKQSYSALLSELDRRTKSQLKLDQFVENVNQSLASFYTSEFNARTEFARQHLAYLPQELAEPVQTELTKLRLAEP